MGSPIFEPVCGTIQRVKRPAERHEEAQSLKKVTRRGDDELTQASELAHA